MNVVARSNEVMGKKKKISSVNLAYIASGNLRQVNQNPAPEKKLYLICCNNLIAEMAKLDVYSVCSIKWQRRDLYLFIYAL